MENLAIFGWASVLFIGIVVIGIIILSLFLMKGTKSPSTILKLVYLYILSFVGIVITVVASIGMLNLVLKNYVFQVNDYGYYYSPEVCRTPKGVDNAAVPATPAEVEKCEQDQKERSRLESQNQIKRDLSSQIAGLVVGLPLWLYHWKRIRKEKEEN